MIRYFDERLETARISGYEQFVSTVINNRPNMSMPRDSSEALAWSQGMLEAAQELVRRRQDEVNGTDLISQLMGDSND